MLGRLKTLLGRLKTRLGTVLVQNGPKVVKNTLGSKTMENTRKAQGKHGESWGKQRIFRGKAHFFAP